MVIWDVSRCRLMNIINISTVSAHTLVYTNEYQVMLSAGNEIEILLWEFANLYVAYL